jgi:hypothetical protein
MPQVPYSPTSTVGPSGQDTPPLQSNAGPDAFGVNVAGAVEGLGKTIESSSDQIFQEAYRLQGLKNEADARDADTQFMIQAGQLHADYSALEGQQRALAFPKYQQDLQEARLKLRAGLGNDMARKMYDANSLSTLGRSIFNGAGAAGAGLKDYSNKTLAASLDQDLHSIDTNSGDSSFVDQKIERIKSSAAQLAMQTTGETDVNSPIVQDAQRKAVSKALATQITSIAKTDPIKAGDMLGKYKDQLGDSYDNVNAVVTTKTQAIFGTQLGITTVNSHFDGKGNLNVPATQLDDEIRDKADSMFPDNKPLAQMVATHAVQTAHGELLRRRIAQTQDDQQNYSIVQDALIKGNNGQPWNSEQELTTARPDVAGAIAALHKKDKALDLPNRINRVKEAETKFTNDQRAVQINGMFSDPQQRAAALDLDLTKEQLSKPDLIRFQDKQGALRNKLDGDPRVDAAVGWMQQGLGDELTALGIDRYHANVNDDDWNNFRGTVQGAIDAFVQDKKRQPSYQEFMKDIAPLIIRQQVKPGALGGLFGPHKDPAIFQQAPPENWATETRSKIISAGGANPTDEQLARAYHRQLFIQLYSKQKSE